MVEVGSSGLNVAVQLIVEGVRAVTISGELQALQDVSDSDGNATSIAMLTVRDGEVVVVGSKLMPVGTLTIFVQEHGSYTVGVHLKRGSLGCLRVLTHQVQALLIAFKHNLHGLGSQIHVKRTTVAVSQNGISHVITGNDHVALTALTVEHIIINLTFHVHSGLAQLHLYIRSGKPCRAGELLLGNSHSLLGRNALSIHVISTKC